MKQKLILPLTPEEIVMLEEIGRSHRFGDYRFKARSIIAINAQVKPQAIADLFGVSLKSVYNWAVRHEVAYESCFPPFFKEETTRVTG